MSSTDEYTLEQLTKMNNETKLRKNCFLNIYYKFKIYFEYNCMLVNLLS